MLCARVPERGFNPRELARSLGYAATAADKWLRRGVPAAVMGTAAALAMLGPEELAEWRENVRALRGAA